MSQNNSGFAGMTNASANDAEKRSAQTYRNSDSPFVDGVEFEIDLSPDSVKGEWVAGRQNGDDRNGYGYQQVTYNDGSKSDRLNPVLWVKILQGSMYGAIVPMFLSMLTRTKYAEDMSDMSANGEFVALVKSALASSTGKSENDAFTAVVRNVKGVKWRIRTTPFRTKNYTGGTVTSHRYTIDKA